MSILQSPVTPIVEARARLGEGPVWDDRAQRLYWVDIYNHRVHRFDPATQHHDWFDVGDAVGCFALTDSDRLLLGLRHQVAWLNLSDRSVTPLAEVEADQPQTRINDGKCDAAGRFWVGSTHMAGKPQASLYRYDPDGTLTPMETNLTISNGLGWSPDNQTFYLTDSAQHKIFAYDFDLDHGTIQNRRVLIDLTDESLTPDGLTLDQDGCIWSAIWDGWCVIRFSPEGRELERVELPIQRPTSCHFGGPDLKTLYITSASVGLSEAEIQDSFLSGDVFCVQTEVAGLPSYRFGTTDR